MGLHAVSRALGAVHAGELLAELAGKLARPSSTFAPEQREAVLVAAVTYASLDGAVPSTPAEAMALLEELRSQGFASPLGPGAVVSSLPWAGLAADPVPT